jgi:hypothetical protein
LETADNPHGRDFPGPPASIADVGDVRRLRSADARPDLVVEAIDRVIAGATLAA